MSLDSYKNSSFVKVVYAFGQYQFDFTSSKSVQSIQITENLSTGDGGPEGQKVAGQVTVADYYEDLFTLITFISNGCASRAMNQLVNSANRSSISINHPNTVAIGDGNLGTIAIGIKCFSGSRIWFLHVASWSYSFGTPSTITFNLDQSKIDSNIESIFSQMIADFGSYRATDPRNASNLQATTQAAIASLQNAQNSDVVSSSGDVATETPKGVVGPKFTDPLEVFDFLKDLYGTEIRFTTVEMNEFSNPKDWVDKLKKKGQKLFLRNGVYELKTYSSTTPDAQKNAEETEFESLVLTMYSASEVDAEPKIHYEPKVMMRQNGRYLVAVYMEDRPVVDKEGIDLSLDRVVFIYNAPKPVTGLWNNKLVIPLNSLSASVDSSSFIDAAFKITDTPNGTMVFTPSGRYMTNENAAGIYMRMSAIAGHNAKVSYKISMTCDNYIHWENNITAYAEIYSYTSNGLPGVVQGKYMVDQSAISWNGGVVSSTVHLTKQPAGIEASAEAVRNGGSNLHDAYNNSALKSQVSIMNQVYDEFMKGGGEILDRIEDNVSSEDCGSPDFSQEVPMCENQFKAYLCSKDSVPVPISVDKTITNLSNGKFDSAVSAAIELQKTSGRIIPYQSEFFQKNIVEDGNFGLLGLLMATANWGMSGVPSEVSDPCMLCSANKSRRPWFGPNEGNGKGFFDYEVGGLGIAHWDSSNLQDIYESVGFSRTEATAEMLNLLYRKDADKASWAEITSGTGKGRMKPVLVDAEKKVRLFDGEDKKRRGLASRYKSDDPSSNPWQNWANYILNYKDSSGVYTYQVMIARLWITKFWQRTIKSIRDGKGTLNDVFRISRAGNSASGIIGKCVQNGACVSVEQQYLNYMSGKTKDKKTGQMVPAYDYSRYMNQKGFCRRCADLIGYMYSKGLIKP